MRKSVFALLALAISLFGTQCWAQENCSFGEGDVSCTFSPGTTRGVYEFDNDGRLVVDFDTVLRTFTLTVNVSHPSNPLPLDPNVFPEGTVCVHYPTNATGVCDRYDFSGNAGGPNGVPVKNVDYRRLITLTLSYISFDTARNPAFGHAPGDITTFTEDILTSYSVVPATSDPTMGGKTPGLSSVVALDEPLTENDSFCFVSPQPFQTFTVGQKIEVEFRLTNGATCNTGTPLRDKTARFSLSTIDTSGNVVFPRLRNKEEGNKFHFDHKDGVNEFDLSTKGLAPGSYTITVFGSKFSPQSVDFILVPCSGVCDDDKDDD